MEKAYEINCTKCSHRIGFKVEDVEQLAGDIADRVSTGRGEGYDEAREEYGPAEDNDVTWLTSRPLWELAAVIRRGDTAEAELQLDRVAEELGYRAVDQVQQGRFSPQAKRVAA